MIVLIAAVALIGLPMAGFAGVAVDSDNDGIVDVLDNCSAKANASQNDADGDGCGNRCDQDVTQDGLVAILDFSQLALNFGSSVPPAPAALDFDEPPDHLIAIIDFSQMSLAFGGTPGPSGTTSGTTACP
jgi:hypothetical protein